MTAFAEAVLAAMGAPDAVAREVAEHLVEADLMGVHSHGTMRLVSYSEHAANGLFDPAGTARLTVAEGGAPVVDGGNGFGMPAMRIGVEEGMRRAGETGIAVFGVVNVGHTGRIGAFAERAAEAGMVAIILGGGGRKEWRQVAPFGGARGMLPTNPVTFALPGGAEGPVVVDFATSAAAAGKVQAARYAGRPLDPGLLIDAEGRPTTDPEDYARGGAILPAAGPKGYGMALVAELLGGAMLGSAMQGMNWLGIILDPRLFRGAEAYRAEAEACLAELRACPPAPGHARVEIPGERERRLETERRQTGIPVPPSTLETLRATARRLGVDPALLEG